MAKLSYYEQLKHPSWQRKRLEMLEQAGWTCQSCGAKDDTLHVHHRRYIKGQMVWEYEGQDLEVLCEACHSNAHAAKDVLEWMVTHGDAIKTPAIAAALVAGWLAYDEKLHDESVHAVSEMAPATFRMGVNAQALMFYESKDIAAFLENTPRAVKDPMPPALLEVIETMKKAD
jgi:hypothetical protein